MRIFALLVVVAFGVPGCALLDAFGDDDDGGGIIDPPDDDAGFPVDDGGNPIDVCSNLQNLGSIGPGGISANGLDPCIFGDDPIDLRFLEACGFEGFGSGLILGFDVPNMIDVEVCVSSSNGDPIIWAIDSTECREPVLGDCGPAAGGGNQCMPVTLFGPRATLYVEGESPLACPSVDVLITQLSMPTAP